jgi:hypothetical protein
MTAGVRRFSAVVLGENREPLGLFNSFGDVRRAYAAGVVELVMSCLPNVDSGLALPARCGRRRLVQPQPCVGEPAPGLTSRQKMSRVALIAARSSAVPERRPSAPVAPWCLDQGDRLTEPTAHRNHGALGACPKRGMRLDRRRPWLDVQLGRGPRKPGTVGGALPSNAWRS